MEKINAIKKEKKGKERRKTTVCDLEIVEEFVNQGMAWGKQECSSYG